MEISIKLHITEAVELATYGVQGELSSFLMSKIERQLKDLGYGKLVNEARIKKLEAGRVY